MALLKSVIKGGVVTAVLTGLAAVAGRFLYEQGRRAMQGREVRRAIFTPEKPAQPQGAPMIGVPEKERRGGAERRVHGERRVAGDRRAYLERRSGVERRGRW